MGSMFDFNGDGKTDSGEQFIGYEIYRDITGSKGLSGKQPSARRTQANTKIDGFTVFIIILIAWQVLNLIADMMY